MKRVHLLAVPSLLAAGLSLPLGLHGGADKPSPPAVPKRVPWTTSRVKGSPEPPLPYRSERAFPKLAFDNPTLITHVPGRDRFVVGTRGGQLYSFPDDPKVAKADLFCDLTKELATLDPERMSGAGAVYGLTFHPKFRDNRYCYVCYIVNPKKRGANLPDGTRVSRFTVTATDPPRLEPASEKILITWLEGGHNGGCLKFGPDGYLYISTGDATAPSPPDVLGTGQDCGDLLSSILRIDVDRVDKGKPYAVPADNPFVRTTGVRPEIWAFGFRNPWRMSFDRLGGDLWVGDVGWEAWEMVYRVVKGGNYGWAVMEGPQVVLPDAPRGPTPILPPTLQFPHTESASVTGGYVYRGKQDPQLYGTYVCGDWETRTVWGARWDGEKVTSVRVLAQTGQRIVSFGEDEAGELYFVDYDPQGGVYRLVPNQIADAHDHRAFPRKLSETGLFTDVQAQTPAPGVLPFAVNAGQWCDGATSERFAAFPGTSTLTVYKDARPVPKSMFTSRYFFPADAVLVKTLSLETERGNPASRRRVETQLLHFDGTTWRGYSYRWDDAQTDAELVAASGDERTIRVKDADAPGGERTHHWRLLGRGQCLQCHNPWANFSLAFTLEQLDRPVSRGQGSGVRGQEAEGKPVNQLDLLEQLEFVRHGQTPNQKSELTNYWTPLADPYAETADLERRARSYLHVNCAHCHQFGGGGTTTINLRADTTLADMKMLGAKPVQGAFGIHDAEIVCPGDVSRSVLWYRLAVTGQGRMPHIGSEVVDRAGLRLLGDWIAKLSPQRAAPEGDAVRRLRDAEEQPAEKQRETIAKLFEHTDNALQVLGAVEGDGLPGTLREQVIAVSRQARPEVRNLFDRFLPESLRIRRLGDRIDPAKLLAVPGDAERGKSLLLANQAVQCLNCHRVGDQGKELGPDLTKIAEKLTRPQILENVLQPSRQVEAKYQTQVVTTAAGAVHTGLLVEKTASHVVLRDARGETTRLPAGEVDEVVAQPVSLMPEGTLRDLTEQQAADLLAYLATLK